MCIFQKVKVTFGKADPSELRRRHRRDGLYMASERASYNVEKPRPISYIATATEQGKYFAFKVLASNATTSEYAGQYLDFEEGKKAVEHRYGNVSWVSPYRFQKEISAC